MFASDARSYDLSTWRMHLEGWRTMGEQDARTIGRGTHLRRLRGERGAGFVEYALLVALIVLVCFAAMIALGRDTSARTSDSADKVAAAN